jgi:hypothetical protein
MVSAYLNVLMLLTDYMGENNYREQQGTALVAIIITNVLLNFLKFFYSLSKATMRYCRKRKLMRERQQKIDE